MVGSGRRPDTRGPTAARVSPAAANVGASVRSGYPAMPLSVARYSRDTCATVAASRLHWDACWARVPAQSAHKM
jgi:hypothetical protein